MKDDFSLYEAMLWEPDKGYFLLEPHLERLARSAAYFHRTLDLEAVRSRLGVASERFHSHPRKVRVEVSGASDILVEDEPIVSTDTISFAIAREPVEASDPFLRHKTSRRAVYDRALSEHPEAEEVILWNERGELTESCRANLVLEMDGRRLTPALGCGLLPGTFRAYLLARGEIEEAVLPLELMEKADEIFLINSVRFWRRGVRKHRA